MSDNALNLTGLGRFLAKLKTIFVAKADLGTATDQTAGLVKTNSAQSIEVDATGHLTVGGRLGQTEDLGLYSPVFADPVKVGRFSLLMSEAKGLSAAHRELIIAGGNGLTLKTAAQAGATEYRV